MRYGRLKGIMVADIFRAKGTIVQFLGRAVEGGGDHTKSRHLTPSVIPIACEEPWQVRSRRRLWLGTPPRTGRGRRA